MFSRSILGRLPLPLRANLTNGFLRNRGHTGFRPNAIVCFSTRQALLNKQSIPNDTQGNDSEKGIRYWKYDISFRTQIEKIVVIAFLALISSTVGPSWYRDMSQWWKGVPDDGDE
ncbi:hypothetical protein BDV12DRAFT_174820 [Aspergillus spectabilis]